EEHGSGNQLCLVGNADLRRDRNHATRAIFPVLGDQLRDQYGCCSTDPRYLNPMMTTPAANNHGSTTIVEFAPERPPIVLNHLRLRFVQSGRTKLAKVQSGVVVGGANFTGSADAGVDEEFDALLTSVVTSQLRHGR